MSRFNNVTVYLNSQGNVSSVWVDGVKASDHTVVDVTGLKIAHRSKTCVVYNPTGSMTKVADAPASATAAPQWQKVASPDGDNKAVWSNGKYLARKCKAKSGRYYYKVIA